MSKEIEEMIDNLKCVYNSNYEMSEHLSDTEFNNIINALTEYEAIKNVEPTKALELVDKMANYILLDEEYGFIDEEEKQTIIKDRDTIKQALLQKSKKEQAWEIVKEKCLTNCNLALVKDNLHYQNYCKEFEYFLNKYNESPNGFEITKDDLLTEEEFNTLKENVNENNCRKIKRNFR